MYRVALVVASTYPGGTVLEHRERTPPSEVLGFLARSRPTWHADAACRETPGVNFFPDRGENCRAAKAVCAGCLVRDDCRAWSLEQDNDLAGVWGGWTRTDRRRHRQDLGRAPKATGGDCPKCGRPALPTSGRCSACLAYLFHIG